MSRDKHDSESLQRYLSGQMTARERHAFERQSLDDPFLQEALEGAETIDAKIFNADITSLNQRINAKKSTFVWWRIAAAVALLMISGVALWLLQDTKSDQLLAEKLTSEETPVAELQDTTASEPVAQLQELEKIEEAPNLSQPEEDETIPPVEQPTVKPVEMDEDMDKDYLLADNVRIEDAEDVESDVWEDVPAANSGASMKEEELKAKKSEAASASKARAQNKAWFQTSAPIKRVRGQVKDDFGDPLPGVNVVIKGTTTGVTTDLDGNYELKLPENDPVIVLSSVGMQTQEVEVGERTEIDVYLSSDNAALQEVVVTGYGSFDNDPDGFVETEPVMGLTEFKKYLEENLFYPEEAISEGIEGRVVLQLTISVIGNIKEIEVKRSLGFGCDEEAIRLIKEGPRWKPATRDGLNIETKVRVRVKFELK